MQSVLICIHHACMQLHQCPANNTLPLKNSYRISSTMWCHWCHSNTIDCKILKSINQSIDQLLKWTLKSHEGVICLLTVTEIRPGHAKKKKYTIQCKSFTTKKFWKSLSKWWAGSFANNFTQAASKLLIA